ncbi:dUTP diphosphatase [Mycoplasmopsis cricetuli]|uniref:dUTP diphosphatase n=1 Tax=Mycoplasmopsis cricetuli TaxID=171283 RepID=UPI00046FB1CD|nr:dUTP diphosphatase [Mycoplasmopsis cricetuli]
MDLTNIFRMQRDLDEKIQQKSFAENKHLTQQDILISGTIALIVEAAEFANEVQSFKYWKKNKNISKNKILEEFADLIHFLVSYSNRFSVNPQIEPRIISSKLNLQFQALFISLTEIMKNISKETITYAFEIAIGTFKMLNFDYDELYAWYLHKNKTNYQRIKNNY